MQCIFLEDYGWELMPLHEDVSGNYASIDRAQYAVARFQNAFVFIEPSNICAATIPQWLLAIQ